MSSNLIDEARRQLQICNACRYCESFCAVFPAVHSRRAFGDGDIRLFADLCHNCRGCYYACQYVEPHEFAVNLPAVLAELRQQNWSEHAWPGGLARVFQRSGVAIALAAIAGFALILGAIAFWTPESGEGFYGVMSHGSMLAIFLPAFLLPLIAVALGLRRYWRSIGGKDVRWSDVRAAFGAAATMRNLDGGHGDGCNFEDEDRFSQARRWFHQATLYGFLLCFLSTSAGTLKHYLLDLPAPYGLLSLPKLFGVSGGILLCIGTAGLALLKLRADPTLGAARAFGGEMGFILLLFTVSATGLALYAFGGTSWLAALLVIHLGAVLAFFLLMPYSKMVHGFFRLAALVKNAGDSRA